MDDLALDGAVPLADLTFPPALFVGFGRQERVGEQALGLSDLRIDLCVDPLHGERVWERGGQPQVRCGEFHVRSARSRNRDLLLGRVQPVRASLGVVVRF